MSTQLSAREKTLASIVGGAVAILLSLFLIKYFIRNNAAMHADLVVKKTELQGLQTLLADAPLWQQRDARLHALQPKIDNEATASNLLLNQVLDAAKSHTVTIGQHEIKAIAKHPEYDAALTTVEAKATWKDLLAFLHEMQGPEKFVVFENAKLQIDPLDNTKMVANLQIAKWCAPK